MGISFHYFCHAFSMTEVVEIQYCAIFYCKVQCVANLVGYIVMKCYRDRSEFDKDIAKIKAVHFYLYIFFAVHIV